LALVQVVVVTGKCQVAQGITPPVLLGDDVFDVEDGQRVVSLVEAAVFTAVVRSPPDVFLGSCIHHEPFSSRARALAWRMATMPLAIT
jgi:hypothetical protein